jgi:hypothetical protein
MVGDRSRAEAVTAFHQPRARLPLAFDFDFALAGNTPATVVFAGKAQISFTTQRGHSGLRALHT